MIQKKIVIIVDYKEEKGVKEVKGTVVGDTMNSFIANHIINEMLHYTKINHVN